MKISTKPCQVSQIVCLTILLYLSASDLFGRIDFSLLVPGEMYDFVFLAILLWSIADLKIKGNPIHKSINALWPYFTLLIVAVIQGVFLQIKGTQGIGASLSVIRELLFILIIYPFTAQNYNTRKVIKVLIVLDSIAALVYIVEMLYGGPITGFQLHTSGFYEPIGSVYVWRAWSNSPLLAAFTAPFLFIMIIRKNPVFKSTLLDTFAFALICIGTVCRLGRMEIFTVACSCVLALLISDGKDYRKKLIHILGICFAAVVSLAVMYVVANGFFVRLWNGVLGLINFADSSYDSTLSVRTIAVQTRIEYILSNSCAFFGVGPLHRDFNLMGLNTSIYDYANGGVLSSDSAYATFLLRYGFVGTALYVLGLALGGMKLIHGRTPAAIASGVYLFTRLLAGITGYESWGKHALLLIGMLVGVAIKDESGKGKKTDECYASDM